ncbi:MAG: hypothetical protein J6P44_07705 [Bacteroidales bacterium]|nr:hypothetical protein [Bacteroidales bacterium]
MNTFNFKGTFDFLKRHTKLLCIVFVASGIVAAGISLLMPNYYKSEVLLLPSEFNSLSKAVLNEGDSRDLFLFGTEKESEYILEMLSSWQIIEKTAGHFNLREHYKLKNTKLDNEKMVLKLQKNIKVKRSDYLGAKLQVWDQDPKYACDIANYMVEQLQELRYKMKQAKADSIMHSLSASRDSVRNDIIKLTDSLQRLQTETGLYYPNLYADRFAQELAKQIAAGNQAAVTRLETKMQNLNVRGALIAELIQDLEQKSKTMQTWDEHYQQAVMDYNSNIPVDFIAQYATEAAKKDKPHRSIIVIIAALACTLIAAEVLVIKEKYLSSDSEDAQIDRA